MRNFYHRILFLLIWLTGHLPLRFLYFISDCLFPSFYYLVAYRKKLTINNIKNSFPDWSEEQVTKTVKKFYHYFIDLLMESISGYFMDKDELQRRFIIKNAELCNKIHDTGKSICVVLSHYGNWELSAAIQFSLKHRVLGIYKPLNNKFYDTVLKERRERYGAELIPMEKILKSIIDYRNKNIPTITFFLADQRPLKAHIQYWLKFLNQDTPVVLGPEKISRKFNMAVFFMNIIPVKRGFYEAEFIPLFENAGKTEPYEITIKYHEIMEEIIRKKPEYWLWTHNRWKHKR